jgi:diguanylate cyclase (GGDEF)-like protein
MRQDLDVAAELIDGFKHGAFDPPETSTVATRLLTLFDRSPDFILLMDSDNRPLFFNQRLRHELSLNGDAVHDHVIIQALIDSIQDQLPFTGDSGLHTWEGEIRVPLRHSRDIRTVSIVIVIDDVGELDQYVAVVGRDVTERKRLDDRLAYQASRDQLTGLHNRPSLMRELDRQLNERRATGHSLALLFMDLDNMKHINDGAGHHVGDAVLVEVAHRLRASCRDQDFICRLGGDEFVIVCPRLDNEAEAVEIADRVRRAVTGRLIVDGAEVFTSVSVGVAFGPHPYWANDSSDADAAAMLRRADGALYLAKRRGRSRVELWDERQEESSKQRLGMTVALERALDGGDELFVEYQPVVRLADFVTVGAESLVRWNHPQLGPLAPDRFIEIAEESGMIVRVGSWVFQQAMNDLHNWRLAGLVDGAFVMSVNASARQLVEPGFAELVTRTFEAPTIDPRQIMLEVTESTLLTAFKDAGAVLSAFHEMGVGIAFDDFGTGYSSLNYLRRYPVDQLKLDASFVDGVGSAAVDTAVVRSAIELAHALGMTVVAEGIKTPVQLATLAEFGCEYGQGELFSPALSAAAFWQRPTHLRPLTS